MQLVQIEVWQPIDSPYFVHLEIQQANCVSIATRKHAHTRGLDWFSNEMIWLAVSRWMHLLGKYATVSGCIFRGPWIASRSCAWYDVWNSPIKYFRHCAHCTLDCTLVWKLRFVCIAWPHSRVNLKSISTGIRWPTRAIITCKRDSARYCLIERRRLHACGRKRFSGTGQTEIPESIGLQFWAVDYGGKVAK